jgi:hypothetical protein
MVLLSEPTTLASDWVLAAVAAALGLRLHRAGDAQGRGPRTLWAAAFLVGAVGALAGGAVHGFAASLSPLAHAVLWKSVLVAVGSAGSLVLAGAVRAAFGGACRRRLLAGAAGQLALYLAAVSTSDDIGTAVWNGAVTILALLAVALAPALRDKHLGWILLGLALSAASLAAQRAGVAAGILNHNDVCHVLQAAALWPFYRAGRDLRDHGSAGDDQRPSFSRKTALSRPASSFW